MAPPDSSSYSLKTLFNRELVEALANDLRAASPQFQRDGFVASAIDGLEELELKERSRHTADALSRHLPESFEAASDLLIRAMGQDDGSGGLEGFEGFRYMPFLDLVAVRGIDTPERALDVMERMTLFFSAEFAVRPYLLRYPELALPRLDAWSRHSDWRVRRLASEGSRPRLPWAPRLPFLIDDPSPVVPILTRLHNDPHLVVRRSVANHLNDIAKDHPDLAARLAGEWWQTGTDDARWTVRHGLRTLVKKGHAEALAVLGFSGGQNVTVDDLDVSSRGLKIGETLTFAFNLTSQESQATKLVVDYALHRRLKNGKTAPKVFKLGTAELKPGESRSFEAKRAFKQLSTRTYYPGTHRIEILANGHSVDQFEVELLANPED